MSLEKANKLFEAENYREAAKCFKQVLEDGAKNPLVNLNLARCYQETNRHRQAIDQYNRALAMFRLFPNTA